VQFDEMTSLEAHGADSFVGQGPQYRGGVLFGGQVVAQSLVAAASTVQPGFRVHSLHAYFLRRGVAAESIRFEVERIRDGRSFATRQVVASQSHSEILRAAMSFHAAPTDPFVPRNSFPDVASPETVADASWSPTFERRVVSEEDGRIAGWLRIPATPTDDDVRAAAALAFMSDDLPISAVRSQQQAADRDPERGWIGVSLDHTIWFHGTPQNGAWQLHDFRCEGLGFPRGLTRSQVFAQDGSHLATVTQEVLLILNDSET
jgi:acyl-CoA thioesterase-2